MCTCVSQCIICPSLTQTCNSVFILHCPLPLRSICHEPFGSGQGQPSRLSAFSPPPLSATVPIAVTPWLPVSQKQTQKATHTQTTSLIILIGLAVISLSSARTTSGFVSPSISSLREGGYCWCEISRLFELMNSGTLHDVISIPTAGTNNTIEFTDLEIENAKVVDVVLKLCDINFQALALLNVTNITPVVQFLKKYECKLLLALLNGQAWKGLHNARLGYQKAFLLAVHLDDHELRNRILEMTTLQTLLFDPQLVQPEQSYAFFKALPDEFKYALCRAASSGESRKVAREIFIEMLGWARVSPSQVFC